MKTDINKKMKAAIAKDFRRDSDLKQGNRFAKRTTIQTLADESGYSRSKVYRQMDDQDPSELTVNMLIVYAKTVKGRDAARWLYRYLSRFM